jgi:hypothetical protein
MSYILTDDEKAQVEYARTLNFHSNPFLLEGALYKLIAIIDSMTQHVTTPVAPEATAVCDHHWYRDNTGVLLCSRCKMVAVNQNYPIGAQPAPATPDAYWGPGATAGQLATASALGHIADEEAYQAELAKQDAVAPDVCCCKLCEYVAKDPTALDMHYYNKHAVQSSADLQAALVLKATAMPATPDAKPSVKLTAREHRILAAVGHYNDAGQVLDPSSQLLRSSGGTIKKAINSLVRKGLLNDAEIGLTINDLGRAALKDGAK